MPKSHTKCSLGLKQGFTDNEQSAFPRQYTSMVRGTCTKGLQGRTYIHNARFENGSKETIL